MTISQTITKVLVLISLLWIPSICIAEPPLTNSLASGQVGKVYFKTVDRKITSNQLNSGQVVYSDTVSGDFILPDGKGPFPAMVIAHGSGGIVKREYVWADYFKAKGIASFIIDTYQPRGIKDTVADQSQLSYVATAADHLVALKLLATHPAIDTQRIGIIGFSRGGIASVGTAFDSWRKILAGNLKFAVHLPFYGGCAWIADHWDGSPIHLFIGDSDDYAQPVSTCEAQVRFFEKAGMVHSLNVYPDAKHGFDNLERNSSAYLPRAQSAFKCSYIWNVESPVFYSPASSEQSRPRAQLEGVLKECASTGTTVGPNPKATEAAKAKVDQILAETLLKR